MKTVETIRWICRGLDEQGLTVAEAQRVLALTGEFLALSEQVAHSDKEAKPADVLSALEQNIARKRMKRANLGRIGSVRADKGGGDSTGTKAQV